MNYVAIVGVGLIGGSFGLALRKAGFQGEIAGVSSRPALEAGLRAGAISTGITLEQATSRADLIYLAQPVDRILETLESLGPIAPADCLVTDAGSTKAAILKKASECLASAQFLGGHPMAGKEQRGADAADADLFGGRPYVLTPASRESDRSRSFRSWLERIGASVIEMSAQDHDEAVAFTSHLPQLLSTALAATLDRRSDLKLERVFGAGLLDMTRLALSSPDLWLSILATNKSQVRSALESLILTLGEMRDALQRDALASLFASGGEFASRLRTKTHEK
ncbi:MAG: prephenate dehydrogenase/arogenate dehydrogenase family protein [Acidobacteriaceae bacterium]|nr:prephenate dehydrogenase/arogenate dehydrogenase family protein [Acidobacteriaceae bacterium]